MTVTPPAKVEIRSSPCSTISSVAASTWIGPSDFDEKPLKISVDCAAAGDGQESDQGKTAGDAERRRDQIVHVDPPVAASGAFGASVTGWRARHAAGRGRLPVLGFGRRGEEHGDSVLEQDVLAVVLEFDGVGFDDGLLRRDGQRLRRGHFAGVDVDLGILEGRLIAVGRLDRDALGQDHLLGIVVVGAGRRRQMRRGAVVHLQPRDDLFHGHDLRVAEVLDGAGGPSPHRRGGCRRSRRYAAFAWSRFRCRC